MTDGQLSLTSATASRPGIVLESTNEDANPPFLRFQKNGASPADNDEVGLIAFYADDDAGNVFIPAQIKVTTDDVSDGTEDGFIKFFTTVNGTLSEKMRITEDDVLIGSTSTNESERLHVAHTGGGVVSLMRTPNSGNTSIIIFRNANGNVGSVTTNGSSTAYNETSDYRLKENVDYEFNALERVAQLKPARYNFIKEPDETVDGFLAHEVTAVPEAIKGTKDEVDSDNNPVYQGIDQSKLVPLLTAALQESVTEIESLKSRLDAAGL